jgi:hypothetical protein
VACVALESRMTHISGFARSQILLLQEAVDDYVGADNPARFIDAFVDELDLSAAGFLRVAPKATGRPGYAPGDLLKLYIYGYLNRVRSSRRLETECHFDGIDIGGVLDQEAKKRPSSDTSLCASTPRRRFRTVCLLFERASSLVQNLSARAILGSVPYSLPFFGWQIGRSDAARMNSTICVTCCWSL